MVPNVVEYVSDISANYKQHLHIDNSAAFQSIKKEFKLMQNTVLEHINFNYSANITIFILLCGCKNIPVKLNGNAGNDIHLGEMPDAEYFF